MRFCARGWKMHFQPDSKPPKEFDMLTILAWEYMEGIHLAVNTDITDISRFFPKNIEGYLMTVTNK